MGHAERNRLYSRLNSRRRAWLVGWGIYKNKKVMGTNKKYFDLIGNSVTFTVGIPAPPNFDEKQLFKKLDSGKWKFIALVKRRTNVPAIESGQYVRSLEVNEICYKLAKIVDATKLILHDNESMTMIIYGGQLKQKQVFHIKELFKSKWYLGLVALNN